MNLNLGLADHAGDYRAMVGRKRKGILAADK